MCKYDDFIFWERIEAFRKFLLEVQLSMVLRSVKRVNVQENMENMEKFKNSSTFTSNMLIIYG